MQQLHKRCLLGSRTFRTFTFIFWAGGITLFATIPVNGSTARCNSDVIQSLLHKSGQAQNDSTKLAVVNEALSRELQRCYESGRSGGAFWSLSPLSDLNMAADTLLAAAQNWKISNDRRKTCEDARRAVLLFNQVIQDTSVSKPPSINDNLRNNAAPIVRARAQQLARNC